MTSPSSPITMPSGFEAYWTEQTIIAAPPGSPAGQLTGENKTSTAIEITVVESLPSEQTRTNDLDATE